MKNLFSVIPADFFKPLNSKYKDQCILVLNTSNHRYAGTNKEDFLQEVEKCKFAGNNWCRIYNSSNEIDQDTLNRSYNKDTFATMYVRKYNERYFYDENLRKMDLYNYNLISEIYSDSISVLTECSNAGFTATITPSLTKGVEWIKQEMLDRKKFEYTYQELESIFSTIFKEHNLKWDRTRSIKLFPNYTKKRKQIKGNIVIYYIFNI